MDTSQQLYETEATGWKRGVYDDVKATFRAPIINWIWRTLMANEPGFTRYLWGQVKPLFQIEAFGRFSLDYRDAILSAIEDIEDLPTYRREEVDISPAEFRELCGQLATFDIVSSRLAVLFETVDRVIHNRPLADSADLTRTTTAPMPEWIDTDRGRAPTMIAFSEIPQDLEQLVGSIQSFHGFDEGLPSIYRCLLQWPEFAEQVWNDLNPILTGESFSEACKAANDLTTNYVENAPYSPKIAPSDLQDIGIDDETIKELRDLFREFNTGAVEQVLPTLPVFAAVVDVSGPRK